MSNSKMYIETPLWRSNELSQKMKCDVWLKLEILQTSGSFKTRGLGNFCQKRVNEGCKQFVSSSGGNAGLAAAYCANELGVPITVVVPESTPDFVRDKMKQYGAKVELCGKTWNEANTRAEEIAAKTGGKLVHPFDHPDTWEGHASIMEEVKEQLHGEVPDLVVLSVGGGGLMCGVLEGLHRVGWEKVPVLAMETIGLGGGLHACDEAKEWVTLEGLSPCVDPCLGVKHVCKRSFEWLSQHPVITHVVPESEAVLACLKVAKDYRFLIQPACGVSFAALYGDSVTELQKSGKIPVNLKNIVVIVCGGSLTNADNFHELKTKLLKMLT